MTFVYFTDGGVLAPTVAVINSVNQCVECYMEALHIVKMLENLDPLISTQHDRDQFRVQIPLSQVRAIVTGPSTQEFRAIVTGPSIQEGDPA